MAQVGEASRQPRLCSPAGPLAEGLFSSQSTAPVSAAAMMTPAAAYGRTRVSMPRDRDRRM